MSLTILPEKTLSLRPRPHRSRLLATVSVVAIVCGGSFGAYALTRPQNQPATSSGRPSSPLATLPAAVIVQRATAAALAAGSVHVQGSGVVLGQRMSETLDAARNVGAQTVTIGRMSMSARVIGSVTYFSGNAAAVAAQLQLPAVNAGRWFQLVGGDRAYKDITDGVTLDSAMKDLGELSSPMTVIAHGTVDGQAVVGVHGTITGSGSTTKATGTLWVAATGRPLPVGYVAGSPAMGEMTAHFSKWGAPIHVSAPPHWHRLPGAATTGGANTAQADAAVKIDLRNLATLEETYFTDNAGYATAAQLRGQLRFALPSGDTIAFHLNRSTSYCLAGHIRTGRYWIYSSAEGGMRGPASSDTCSKSLYPQRGGTLTAGS